MATFTVEITPDSSNGTIAHAVGKFSGGSSSYKGQRRMDVAVSGVGTFSALSPETSGGENTFSLDITGLTPGTTYNWSASLYYKNTSGGWVTAGSQYDKSGSFTTANSGTTSTVPLSAKAVRSTVKLNVNGAAKEFIIVHKGKPSSMYDDSCDGVWLLMKDIYEMRQWNSNSELLYENSSIHSYLNSTFLNLFDANIRDAIKQVKIPYLKGGKGGSVQSGANGLSCKVFLLGGYELNFRDIFPADGAGLDGFAKSITDNPAYLATYNGTLTKWWLRSISTLKYSDNAGLVSGYTYNSESVTKSYGIRPCIILPSNTLVDDSGNVVPVDLTAHKTLVNGTVYTVKGGKCLVNGTVYNILKGRTLIGGTGYDINFEPDVSLTWYFNQTLSIPVSTTSTTFSTRAHYEGGSKTITGIQIINRGDNPNMSYLGSGFASTAWDQRRGWRDTAYRTITFDEAPSGDLLAWLQENATPQ